MTLKADVWFETKHVSYLEAACSQSFDSVGVVKVRQNTIPHMYEYCEYKKKNKKNGNQPPLEGFSASPGTNHRHYYY